MNQFLDFSQKLERHKIKFLSKSDLTLSYIMLKNGKHTLKILRCLYRKIFRVCLAIIQDYAWKG